YTYDVNGAANQTLVKLVGDPFDHRPVDGDYAKARFSQPMGLAGLGSTSAFFVTDRGANAIRRVGTNTGDLKVSTVVGRLSQCFLADGTGAAARFAFPTGVASDGAGFLYVTDASSDGPRVSNTIRKIELSTGNTSVHAGKPGRPGPSNLPVDGDATTGVFGIVFDLVVVGDSIYVTDPLAHAVRKVSVQTGAISTFAGKLNTPGDTDATGTGALFDSPAGITTDGAGNLYITDAGNFKVKKIEIATAKVSTIAGTTSGSQDGAGNIAQFKQPFGIASDRAGGLFVADMLNATIRRIDLSNNSVSTFLGTAGLPVSTDGNAAQARFTFPSRLAFDPLAGALYVSEGSLDPDDLPVSTVRRVDVAAKTVATHVGRHGASGFMPGPLDAATLSVPAGLAITPSGDLAITDGSDCLVGIVRPF
ncbi:MAG TPA: hypothetical protein VL856_15625, partial [Acidimicrobiia bacterium]|nr:hypothetical protein [Acidimicrobiia bacterium]